MELSKTKAGIYSQLSSRKMREKHGLFAVEGRKSVEDTFRYFEAECVIVVKGSQPPCLPHPENGKEVPIHEVAEPVMRKLSSLSTPSDVMAVYRLPGGKGGGERIDKGAENGNMTASGGGAVCEKLTSRSLYLLLDGIQDPGNLGTIIRTALWFGIRRIFASRDTADLYNPKTIQSTMGSLGRVELTYCDLRDLILGNPELPVYGTLLEGENIYEATLTEHGFILMGNEGKGISEELRRLVTRGLFIPPADGGNHPESLNVGVATGVALSQFRAAAAGRRRDSE